MTELERYLLEALKSLHSSHKTDIEVLQKQVENLSEQLQRLENLPTILAPVLERLSAIRQESRG